MLRRLFLAVTGLLVSIGTATALPAPAPAVGTTSKPARPAEPATISLFRIETLGMGVLWASDHPLQAGDLVTFHKHPDGTLVSIRRSQIRRVSAERVLARAQDVVDIGLTGATGRRDESSARTGGGARGAAKTNLGPGERLDGTALLNPDRKYQPDIDSKQVPGLNMALPASANDYREGRTLAYPAPSAVQSSPGDPPTMPNPPPPKPN